MDEEPTEPAALSEIATYGSHQQAEEFGLVVIAMQMPCWISHRALPDGEVSYALSVLPEDASKARREIGAYADEVAEELARPPGRELPTFPAAIWLAYLYVLVLLLGYWAQTRDPEIGPRFLADNVAIIERGEIFRTATALLLHGDLFHLLGNIVFGVGFGLLVANSLGGFTGWGLILLSGALGNLINAHHYYPEVHRSLGASTAVFGALGLLSGYGMAAAFLAPRTAPWARAILPIAGGLALLGYYGLGGENTDVMAHIYGFAVGLPLGLTAGWIRILRRGAIAPRP